LIIYTAISTDLILYGTLSTLRLLPSLLENMDPNINRQVVTEFPPLLNVFITLLVDYYIKVGRVWRSVEGVDLNASK